ncbi:MAG: DUF554 domain-containing protein [Spirochaetaceae bacterium]|nr:DUF554 domain-containing protein [Spirochaetaceae bacterium]
MIATLINAAAVVIGSLIGMLLNRRIGERVKEVVYAGVGVISLVIGFSMALEMQRVLYLALSIVVGGVLGTWWGIENGILRLGEFLRERFQKRGSQGEFAYGFLSASVLFCVGAMAIVGSFQAGVDGDYELLLTKSIMDGTMAILLTAAMGIGVAFSALLILIYQGGLTLLAVWLRPFVSELMLSEISAVGGALIVMIGISLLGLKRIKTADFVPALLVVIIFVLLDPWIGL